MSILFFSAKDPNEVLVLSCDFAALLGGATVSSASWVITSQTNPAEVTTGMLVGAVDITAAPIVRQKVKDGVAGTSYLHRVSVTLSDGRTITQGIQQAVSLGA